MNDKIINNVDEYFKWRGDLSFKQDPFNEVDNLILSELSYTDFEGAIRKTSFNNPESIKSIYKKYFSIHTKKEIEKRKTFFRLAPFIMDGIVASKRFDDLKIVDYYNFFDKKKVCQFVAVIYELGDGTFYVAFRGTDDSIVGWKEDFYLGTSIETTGQRKAIEYLNTKFKNRKCKIRVGGHSKGGNFAMYSAVFANKNIKKKIIEVYANDAPGFSKEIIKTTQYKEMVPKIKSIVPEDSIVGMLLDTSIKHIVIKSFNKGIMQHDLLSWLVSGNKFIRAKSISKDAILFNKVFVEWMDGMNVEKRRIFADIVFDIFESSGATTFEDIKERGLISIAKMIKKASKMSKMKKELLKEIVSKLIDVSGKKILNQMQEDTLDFLGVK